MSMSHPAVVVFVKMLCECYRTDYSTFLVFTSLKDEVPSPLGLSPKEFFGAVAVALTTAPEAVRAEFRQKFLTERVRRTDLHAAFEALCGAFPVPQ